MLTLPDGEPVRCSFGSFDGMETWNCENNASYKLTPEELKKYKEWEDKHARAQVYVSDDGYVCTLHQFVLINSGMI